ncbi:MAG: helix-turn-helix transcriptional regulator [Actinomycetota bacterium]|nr:MAG: helix-turn-helix transcriptional regulator [Actinomycetota bacterium]
MTPTGTAALSTLDPAVRTVGAGRRVVAPAWSSLRPLFEMASSGWFAYGSDGRLAYVNRSLSGITGSRPAVGSPAFVLPVVPAVSEALLRSMDRLRTGREFTISTVVAFLVRGEPRPHRLGMVGVVESNEPTRSVVGTVAPLLAERADETDAAMIDGIDRVLGRVMHELNEALAPEQGMPEPDSRFVQLSERQREVFHLLLLGERTVVIAKRLHISTNTVRNHIGTIFRRFGVHSQAELIAKCRSMSSHPSNQSRHERR